MKKLSLKHLTSFIFNLIVASLILVPGYVQAQRVVVAQGVDAESLDPNDVFSIPTMVINSNIYDALVARDQNMNIVNRLATSFENLTPTKWRVKIREGVSFHNGEPFKAESVKFSWERLYAPDSKSIKKGMFKVIDRIEILDDYTLDIITKDPDPTLKSRLTLLFIVPPKYVREVGDEKFNITPVGTGPFKFMKWVRDDRVILQRNENYWNGPPQIKELIFRCIPEVQPRLAALQTGEVDIAAYIPPDLAESLKGERNIEFRSVLSTRIIHLQLCTNQESPVLKKKIRQAINYAIDRDSIIKHILKGYGEKLGTFVPKPVFAHDSSLKPYPYDPKKAKQLLAEAGYPNGFEITMQGPSGRYMRDKEVCQAIAGQLSEVGIKTNLQIVEWGTYMKILSTHKSAPIYLLGWSLPNLDPDSWLWPNVHSGEPYSQTNDKEFDAIIEQARHEMDEAKRKELYYKAQRLLYDQAYLAVLYEQKDLFGVNKRIDWTPRSDENVFLRDARIIGSK